MQLFLPRKEIIGGREQKGSNPIFIRIVCPISFADRKDGWTVKQPKCVTFIERDRRVVLQPIT